MFVINIAVVDQPTLEMNTVPSAQMVNQLPIRLLLHACEVGVLFERVFDFSSKCLQRGDARMAFASRRKNRPWVGEHHEVVTSSEASWNMVIAIRFK